MIIKHSPYRHLKKCIEDSIENLHIDVRVLRVNCCCRNVPQAQDIWDDIVMAYPTDILALKMLSDYSTFYGPKERVRDSVARVFPHWKQDAPLYGYSNGKLCDSGNIFKFS